MILDLALPGSAKSRMARGTGRSLGTSIRLNQRFLAARPSRSPPANVAVGSACLDEDDDSAARTPGRDLSYCIELRFRMF
jgi:hypothetical protein